MPRSSTEEPGVFISHAWGKDKLLHGFARQVFRQLTSQGVDCFFDEDALVFGDVWTQAVQRTIEDNRFLALVLVSPEYLESPNCKFELGLIERVSASYGKPIIPVLLKKSDSARRAIGEETIYADVSSLYREFVRSRGRHISDSWKRRLARKVGEVAAAVQTKHNDYLYSLHVYRVQEPRDPILRKPFDLYERYPELYRDPPNRVLSWLFENTVQEAEHRPNEVYLVATYRGRVVGVLYATHYPGRGRGLPGLCHLNVMVVNPSHAAVEERDRSGISRASVVAERLISDLREVVKQCDPGCEDFTLELPNLEADEEEDVIADCWYAWTTVRPEFREFELLRCRNLTYMQPDVDWSVFADREPKALKAELLFLRRPKQGSYIDVERFRPILKRIYWSVYGEAYFDHYSTKEWFEHLTDLYDSVLRSIRGRRVRLEPPEYPSR